MRTPRAWPDGRLDAQLDNLISIRVLNLRLSATASPVADLRFHAHDGAEVLYVLSGTLGLRVGDAEHVLQAGDSAYFDPGVAHAYSRRGRSACRAVIVTAP
jgi:quercetin dioxygenase-like cupin family protein